MSKIIAGVIVLLVVLGGMFLLNSRGETQAEPSTENSEVAGEKQVPSDGTGTFADLMKRGGEWKCTFTSETAVGSSSGTVYIKGSNVRGDFSMEAPMVGALTAHMLADSEYTYSWSSMAPQGVKARRTDTDTGSDTPTSAQMVDENMSLNYSCEKVSVDEALFVVPDTITFTEVN